MASDEIETESPKRPRWTDYLSLDTVEPALVNAKRHDLEAIAASYDRFGYVEPITMDERTGRLVAGHGRIASLLGRRIRGESAPEGIVVSDDGWLVPVARGWESANDYEARAYLIASNKLSEAGGWDQAELWGELADLSEHGELAGLGVADDEMETLRRFVVASGYGDVDPAAEWTGMPEFTSKNHLGLRAIAHFENERDRRAFFEKLGLPEAGSFWFPKHDGWVGSTTHEAYVLDDAEAN